MDPISGIQLQGALDRIGSTLGSARGAPGAEAFGEVLGKAVEGLQQSEAHANNMIQRFAAGEELDIHQVMLAVQEGEATMLLGLQVRNKIIEAYQEVMRMQV